MLLSNLDTVLITEDTQINTHAVSKMCNTKIDKQKNNVFFVSRLMLYQSFTVPTFKSLA